MNFVKFKGKDGSKIEASEKGGADEKGGGGIKKTGRDHGQGG